MRSTRIADYSFSPLSFSDLTAVVRDLDAPELRAWMAAEHSATFFEAITKRLAAELEGKSLMLVIKRDRRVVGLVGLSDYQGLYGTLQTSTYLHPSQWGGGLNGLCKHVLWAVAHDLLGHGSIVASVAAENERSQRAMRRQFPSAPEAEVYEFWRPRRAMLYEIATAPASESPITDGNRRNLRRMLRRTPSWQRWLVRASGKKTRVSFSTDAQVLHTENLYTAVSRVLSEQASAVRALAHEMATVPSDEATRIVAAAEEVVSGAQLVAAGQIVEIGAAAEQMNATSQEMVTEAIIELREDTGERISDAAREEIGDLVEAGEVEQALGDVHLDAGAVV